MSATHSGNQHWSPTYFFAALEAESVSVTPHTRPTTFMKAARYSTGT